MEGASSPARERGSVPFPELGKGQLHHRIKLCKGAAAQRMPIGQIGGLYPEQAGFFGQAVRQCRQRHDPPQWKVCFLQLGDHSGEFKYQPVA
mgnify:CR=1 FL=1